MLKRVVIMLFCLMMVFVATFGFVVGVVAVPTIYSYAETTNNFEPIRDQSDAVYAFQAYCKSRDLTIEGSITDAVTSYTTDAYNYACNKIGVNPTELQAEIKAKYDQTGKPVKFLFSSVGGDAFNRIFSQFLQDNELEVGDNVNKQVYNGKSYNGSLVYVMGSNYSPPSPPNTIVKSAFTQLGSTYLYSGEQFKSFYDSGTYNVSVPFQSNNYEFSIYYSNNVHYGGYYLRYQYPESYYLTLSTNDDSSYKNLVGNCAILYSAANSRYYLGIASYKNGKFNGFYVIHSIVNADTSNIYNTVISLTTNNQTINNNTYEGDTIINNDGDVIVEPDPVPPGGTDPGWDIGGGGGTATDGNGNTWNIQFPDFQMPDLNINWSINGLGEKFPFSIPFDLVALVTVLNAEPQAPRFQGTVNFGFTTWDYDINLQQFDSVAQACRIAEILLLVVGLILVTRSIIKG